MKNKINNTVSVIVPVYKVEQYLDDCLKSLVEQTYKDLEIILVDDGSPDTCGEICDNWAKRDKRINVIHKENGGLSDARNAGLECVHGAYVYFVDSDDKLKKDVIEIAVSYSQKCDADIVISTKNGTNNTNTVKIASGNEIFQEMFHNYFWEAWGKLYKKDLITGIQFKKGRLYEDLAYTPYVVLKANKVVLIDDGAYLYTIRDDSIMGKSKVSIKKDLIENIEELLEYLKFYDKKQRRFILNWSIWFLAEKYLSITDLSLNQEFGRELNNYYKKHFSKVMFFNTYGLRTRWKILKVFLDSK